jgi:hypothetical protein
MGTWLFKQKQEQRGHHHTVACRVPSEQAQVFALGLPG